MLEANIVIVLVLLHEPQLGSAYWYINNWYINLCDSAL